MRPDGQLIRKIKRSRDRDAAGELIDRYYREIYAYAYRQMGDRELAMDLTQDIFIAILQGMDSFDERKAQFRTWAYRVASNKITDYYRSRKHREQQLETTLHGDDWQGDDGRDRSGINEDKGMDDGGVLEMLLNRELIQHIMEIVMGFEADWVRIFQKKCFEEYTFAEIAEEMQLSENTVKTRFYKMLRKVREEVASEG